MKHLYYSVAAILLFVGFVGGSKGQRLDTLIFFSTWAIVTMLMGVIDAIERRENNERKSD